MLPVAVTAEGETCASTRHKQGERRQQRAEKEKEQQEREGNR